jgi:hypothetical protein
MEGRVRERERECEGEMVVGTGGKIFSFPF